MPSPYPTSSCLLRALRTRAGWTLKRMSERSGIPFSTLSKMEHDRLPLSYKRLVSLSENLNLPLTDLFSESDESPFTISSPADNFAMETLVNLTDDPGEVLPRKHMTPAITRIRGRTIAEPEALTRHPGEAYLYVVAGRVEVHTEYYDRLILHKGESVYLDSNMGHACTISEGCEEAMVLSVYATNGSAPLPLAPGRRG